MHLVFTKEHPVQFHLYSDFAHALNGEGKKNLPTPHLHIAKISDSASDETMFEKVDSIFAAVSKDGLSNEEKADLSQKRASFLANRTEPWELSQPRFSLPVIEDNPRLRLYLPKEIAIYADGSFSNGFGGYAAIFLESGRPLASLSGCGKFDSSAEVEWKAVDVALSAIVGDGHHIDVYTDHLQIVQTLYSEKPKCESSTRRFFNHILHVCSENAVIFHHVRGHNGFDGSEWNELADVLAKHERQRIEGVR